MKVKITLDRNAPISKKQTVIAKVHKDLAARVTIKGDVITVDEGNEENKGNHYCKQRRSKLFTF